MDQDQINYVNMVDGVVAGFEDNQPLWMDNSELSDSVNFVKTEYQEIIAKAGKIAGLDLSGFTKAKNSAYESILARAFKLTRKVTGYALKKDDLVILPMVNYSKTSLREGMEKDVVSRCETILQQAEAKLAALVNFKVTQEEIDTIRTLIAGYHKYFEDRSTTQAGKTVTGAEIDQHIANIRKGFKALDPMVEGMIDDATFIATYTELRKVKDIGKGKTSANKTTVNSTEK